MGCQALGSRTLRGSEPEVPLWDIAWLGHPLLASFSPGPSFLMVYLGLLPKAFTQGFPIARFWGTHPKTG